MCVYVPRYVCIDVQSRYYIYYSIIICMNCIHHTGYTVRKMIEKLLLIKFGQA